MPALVTIKRIGKEEKMRTKRKKQIIWEVIILFVLVAVAVGAVQFKRIHEQKMAEKNAVQKVKSVDDLAGRKIGVQIGTTGDIYSTDYAKENKGTEVERYNKGADAIQALKVGKIDSVIIDEQPAKAYCEKNPELKILKDEFQMRTMQYVLPKEMIRCASRSIRRWTRSQKMARCRRSMITISV